MHIVKFTDANAVASALADFIANDISNTLATANRYTMALAGGTTPTTLYTLLATQYAGKIDWQRVHIFIEDERYVPFDDERNNSRMVYDTLVKEVNLPRAQFHPVQTSLPIKEAVQQYDGLLHQYFDSSPYTFDLVLLGMGSDGHTLSLFPGTAAVFEHQRWVCDVAPATAANQRITITAPVVNKAAKVVFLVTGGNKANTLQQVIHGPLQPALLPAQVIRPESGQLYWFIDEAAGAALQA